MAAKRIILFSAAFLIIAFNLFLFGCEPGTLRPESVHVGGDLNEHFVVASRDYKFIYSEAKGKKLQRQWADLNIEFKRMGEMAANVDSLQFVIELLDSNGNVIAKSTRSLAFASDIKAFLTNEASHLEFTFNRDDVSGATAFRISSSAYGMGT